MTESDWLEGTPGTSPTQMSGMAMVGSNPSGAVAHPHHHGHHHPPTLQASHKSRSFSANALYASSGCLSLLYLLTKILIPEDSRR